MVTLVICEENELVRLGLKSALEDAENVDILGTYAYSEGMLSKLTEIKPDVVILGGKGDILDRCRTCYEVRTLCPTTKVLTLTEKHRDDELYKIIISGASGNILTDAGSAEMINSVGVVACGGLNFESEALIRLLGRIPMREQVSSPAEIDKLNRRETAVLSLIAKGYKNSEIGQKLNISTSTVKSDISHLRQKLLIYSRSELAAYAVRHGITQEVQDSIPEHTAFAPSGELPIEGRSL